MGSKIKNIIGYEVDGYMDWTFMDHPQTPSNIFNVKVKSRHQKKVRTVVPPQRKKYSKGNKNSLKKYVGSITMEEFLSRYLEISGPVLDQMKNLTHIELDKMNFEDVKRVPNEIADGRGSEYLLVVDSNNYALAYRNPKEKINSGTLKDIIYKNKHTKCMPKQSFLPEYDELLDENYYNSLEEELNSEYNRIGEMKYEKHKKR